MFILTSYVLKMRSLHKRNIQQFAKSKLNIYKDKTELNDSMIGQILYKSQKVKEIATPLELDPIYDQNIEQILQRVKERQINNEEQEIPKQQKQQEEKKEEIKNRFLTVENKREQMKQVKYMKYELPIPNLRPSIEDYTMVEAKDKQIPIIHIYIYISLENTITMNVFDLFKMDKDTSYEQYENACVDYFNVGIDMYSTNILQPHAERELQISLLGENALPLLRLNNPTYMEYIGKCFSLNLSMPGAIENEHPHRFLKGLRPIEEFRNTPLIPISARQMLEFQEKVSAYHRRGVFLEVKRESIYSFLFGLGIFTVIFHMLRLALQKEEEYGVAFQRIKYRRTGLAHDIL